MTCCNDIKICLKYDYQFIDELSFKVKEKLQNLSSKKLAHLFYGYNCEEDIDYKINQAGILLKSLIRIKVSFLHIQTYCLPDDRVQAIIEKAIKFAGKTPCPKNRRDLNIDSSQINSYLLQGPKCVTYDTWNKFSSFLCGKLGFKLKVEKEICDISFDITRNIVSCNLLYSLLVKKELCDLGYSINKTDLDCKIEYKLILEKYPKCDLEFKTYLSFVRNHNLSYPIFKEVYESGLTLLEKDGDAFLCTPINNYKLAEITPSNLEELLNAGYVITLNKHDIKQDYTRY